MKELKPQLFLSMKEYSGKQLAGDLTAGVIVAIIALPLSIALALASGVTPEQGLYTAIIAGFIISFSAAAKYRSQARQPHLPQSWRVLWPGTEWTG